MQMNKKSVTTLATGVAIAIACLPSVQANAQSQDKLDCSHVTKTADGNWLITGPVDWKPYLQIAGTGKMVVGKGGMSMNGKDLYDVVAEACPAH